MNDSNRISHDRTGFPMIWIEPIEAWLHVLPFTKIQLEYFLVDTNETNFDHKWYKNRLNENLSIFVAFVGLQKAFDCVDRDFLLHKLLNAAINGKMYFAIKTIYSVTNACVKLNNGVKSDWFETLFGVRQGDSLSPSLFSIYLNDFAEEILKVFKCWD